MKNLGIIFNKIMKKLFSFLLVASFLIACAGGQFTNSSTTIKPAYVSPAIYMNLSCNELEREAAELISKAPELENGWCRTPLGGFINHSEFPNCELIGIGKAKYLITKSDIMPDEEITVKYTMYKVSKVS